MTVRAAHRSRARLGTDEHAWYPQGCAEEWMAWLLASLGLWCRDAELPSLISHLGGQSSFQRSHPFISTLTHLPRLLPCLDRWVLGAQSTWEIFWP